MQEGFGWEAEDFVHVADDGAAFIVIEFAFRVAEGLKLGTRLETGVTVFLIAERFASDARQNGEQAEQAGRKILEVGREGRGLEALEEFEDAHDSNLQADFVEPRVFGIVEQFEGVSLAITEFFAPFFLREPVEITTALPTAEILPGNPKAGGVREVFNG